MRRVGSVQLTARLYTATRHNELREDITDLVLGGRVTYDQDRDIKMSFEATVRDPSRVRPYEDFLAPFLTLTYADGAEVTEQLGLYVAAPPKRTATPQLTRGQLDGRDLTWLLASETVDAPYTVAAGTNYLAAVQTILAGMGITRFSFPATGLTLATATTWPPGTSKLRIVNDLLQGAGYYALYMTRDGRLTSQPWRTLASVEPAVRYATPATGRVRVVGAVEIEPDVSRLANKITVIRDDPGKAPLVATAVNDNPASPVSTVSLGVTIAREVRDQNLATQAEANALARRLLEEAASVYTRLKLSTTPDPSRNPHEVYELAIVNGAGDPVAHGRWWCSGWRIGFTPQDGRMEHELNKLVPFGSVS